LVERDYGQFRGARDAQDMVGWGEGFFAADLREDHGEWDGGWDGDCDGLGEFGSGRDVDAEGF
jgi:hypothetical protein